MRLPLVLLITLLGIVGPMHAQKTERVTKKTTKRKAVTSRASYTFYIMDKINEMDSIYSEYENAVQVVWSERLDHKILNKSAAPYLEQLTHIKELVSRQKPFADGEEYKQATLTYLEAVREKVETLEKMGVLGANANSDLNEYYDAYQAFNDATNKGIEARNHLRQVKYTYETGKPARTGMQ
ncbi:hypothetical protein [Dysgonomonas sp. 511]|uniref:hypothetical protein n=1 Tax=Dysgonomonas sp. 511 TaxID=2302930 RepID=UPI0013D60CA4|nr:hypothetical protein [Dysgonomonas sp. 511]NDV77611.1 hypothetical protein [Dysgonomonas sp. 511]